MRATMRKQTNNIPRHLEHEVRLGKQIDVVNLRSAVYGIKTSISNSATVFSNNWAAMCHVDGENWLERI